MINSPRSSTVESSRPIMLVVWHCMLDHGRCYVRYGYTDI